MTSRPSLSLDGDWLLYLDPDGPQHPGEHVDLPPTPPRLARVPAPIQALDDDLRDYTGAAWYRREFELDADWLDGRVVILRFGAAEYFATVWVNEQCIGEHEGGYLPFELDITTVARPGSNTVTVYVSDPPELFRELPHGKQSWYGPLSGLWQSVSVESRAARHVLALRVTTEGDQARLTVDVSQPLAPDDTLTYEVIAPGGEVAARVETNATEARLTVADAQPWDLDSPALYTARVRLHSPAGSDTLADTFGFRTFTTRGGYFYLNDQPLYLIGALDQDYYPDLICTPPSQAYLEDQFRQAKALGLNCLRVHIKVADPRYYAAADRVGLFIWTEIPNWSELNPTTDRRARALMAGAIQRDWNHPSIVIRTIINESWGTELNTNPDHAVWLAEMYDWTKSLDPSRLVVDNSACAPGFHVHSDLDDFHFYATLPDGQARWDKSIAEFAGRAEWLYGPAHQPTRGPDDDHPPLVVSEFGNWGLPDLQPLLDHYGGKEPWWFDTGEDWGAGEVFPRGVAKRFKGLALDKAFGDYTSFAHAAQWGEYDALKYAIESLRLYPNYAGYVITEFTDVHWECNGLLDQLRNPKVFAGALAELNRPSLVIPRAPRAAYWSGEEVAVDLHLSHVGPRPLAGAHVAWEAPEADARGETAVPPAAPFAAPALAPVRFTAPLITGPQKLSLQLVLHDYGTPIGRNHYDFAVFPRLPAPMLAIACDDERLAQALHLQGFHLTDDPLAVRVTTRVTAATRRFLQQGGRVLFLAEHPASLEVDIQRLVLRARQGTAWENWTAFTMAWFRPDLLGDYLPGNGRFDMTLASLVPELVMTTHGHREFQQEIWAGMFAGWLRKPAALIQQLPVGRGVLITTTLPLRVGLGTDPAATTLFHGLLEKLNKP